ncbi:MAG: hypothetical protein MUD08_02575 [Cytophagales bacterium]|nr:hypothetical protein [Cytophagales bacterium]
MSKNAPNGSVAHASACAEIRRIAKRRFGQKMLETPFFQTGFQDEQDFPLFQNGCPLTDSAAVPPRRDFHTGQVLPFEKILFCIYAVKKNPVGFGFAELAFCITPRRDATDIHKETNRLSKQGAGLWFSILPCENVAAMNDTP